MTTTTTITVVLVPCDSSVPLQSHELSWDVNIIEDVQLADTSLKDIHRLLLSSSSKSSSKAEDPGNVVEIPLLRPLQDSPGLYAYYRYNPHDDVDNGDDDSTTQQQQSPNVRATRLAMMCGLLSMRLSGDVVLVRSHPTRQPRWYRLAVDDVCAACTVSPDLRNNVQDDLKQQDKDQVVPTGPQIGSTPDWLLNAAQQNYHDAAAVARMAEVMKTDKMGSDATDDNEGKEDGSDSDTTSESDDNDDGDDSDHKISSDAPTKFPAGVNAREFVAKRPLCLHCRRPASDLCPDCEGAYFCPPPRSCRQDGWSHSCQCHTWRLYTFRRKELSKFEYLDSSWQAELVHREFQLSEEPYRDFLKKLTLMELHHLGQDNNNATNSTFVSSSSSSSSKSWWRTETDGWSGGQSESAKQIDPTVRQTYQEGFAPLPIEQIPRQQRLKDSDFQSAGIQSKNGVGLWKLTSWQEYYRLRDIPPSSPVALLCTFPLTIYHAIVQHGEVPVTVARMLKRSLRIHVVGTEKEMNFLDLFQEVGYLLPEDLKVELVFVVRQDMLPTHCCGAQTDTKLLLEIKMTTNLTVGVVSGTYGTGSDTASSLDPTFDVGTGPPDMVIALNAGIYAYESWRSVIDYLYHDKGVVGVFTDYNEYSGMNCAAIGGAASRESLTINPFRQPLALPVFSMNLPQFSNGFMYVFNAQELE